eukprot:31313-Eustigmatos_ZCMA.PRE.1
MTVSLHLSWTSPIDAGFLARKCVHAECVMGTSERACGMRVKTRERTMLNLNVGGWPGVECLQTHRDNEGAGRCTVA